MKIKEVSERTGLTKKTIRYYEAEGLLPRKNSGRTDGSIETTPKRIFSG